MPLDPFKAHAVLAVHAQETLPQVGVLLVFIALLLPVEHPPFCDCINDVLAVRIHQYVEGCALEGLQGYNYSEQLHTVVGGATKALAELFAVLTPH